MGQVAVTFIPFSYPILIIVAIEQFDMANPMQQGIVPPPPGVVPNFANPAYKSDGVVPVTAVFLVLSTTFLLLRLYTKLRILKAFGVEDCECKTPRHEN